jgi:hypothetical protein
MGTGRTFPRRRAVVHVGQGSDTARRRIGDELVNEVLVIVDSSSVARPRSFGGTGYAEVAVDIVLTSFGPLGRRSDARASSVVILVFPHEATREGFRLGRGGHTLVSPDVLSVASIPHRMDQGRVVLLSKNLGRKEGEELEGRRWLTR